MQRNVFLMNCGQCLTLEELRFVMTNDLRVIKEDFENFTETNISNATDVTTGRTLKNKNLEIVEINLIETIDFVNISIF